MSNSKKDAKNFSDGSTEIIRPPIQCITDLQRIKCQYTWTIKNYLSNFIEPGVTVLQSPTFSATPDTCQWCIELEHDSLLQLWLESKMKSDVTKNGLSGAEVKFAIINSKGQESNIVKNKYELSTDSTSYGGETLIKSSDLIQNKRTLLPQNNLTIHCEVVFTKQESIVVDDSDQFNAVPLEMTECGLEDFEKLFNNEEQSDIAIYVNGKKYSAHKSILTARSKVFAAMFKHDMKENQTNRIDINDNIDDEVFVEALRFIYTGKVQNLKTLAFDLLPVANKYDLKKLEIMCVEVLQQKLSAKTVVKILMLADTYEAETLKKQSIKYIRQYSIDVISKVDWESWCNLSSRPHLMKELFLECSK